MGRHEDRHKHRHKDRHIVRHKDRLEYTRVPCELRLRQISIGVIFEAVLKNVRHVFDADSDKYALGSFLKRYCRMFNVYFDSDSKNYIPGSFLRRCCRMFNISSALLPVAHTMYLFMYVCMYVCIQCTCIVTQILVMYTWVRLYVYAYICVLYT